MVCCAFIVFLIHRLDGWLLAAVVRIGFCQALFHGTRFHDIKLHADTLRVFAAAAAVKGIQNRIDIALGVVQARGQEGIRLRFSHLIGSVFWAHTIACFVPACVRANLLFALGAKEYGKTRLFQRLLVAGEDLVNGGFIR